MTPGYLAYLDAFARAYPLRAELAFQECTTTLTASLDKHDKHELRSKLCRELSNRGRGRSHDLIGALVTDAWIGDNDARSVHLASHVQRWAKRMLQPVGRGVSVRAHNGDGGRESHHARAVLAWRWASLMVPRALLVGAVVGDARGANVALATPRLEAALRDAPWAELHIHAGASVDFDSWWVEHLARPEREKAAKHKVLGADAHSALRVAALLRIVLHGCMERGLGVCELLAWLRKGAASPDQTAFDAIEGVLYEAEQGCIVDNGLSTHVDSLARALNLNRVGWEAARLDMQDGDELLAEVTLVRRYYASPNHKASLPINKLFWQYQRLRQAFFSRLVPEPRIGGLAEFKEHYGRIDDLATPRTPILVRAWDVERHGINLHALEVRPAMPRARRYASAASWAKGAIQVIGKVQMAGGTVPEMGIILSFLKRPHCDGIGGSEQGQQGVRYGDYIHALQVQSRSMVELFEKVPALLTIVRGIDMASHELQAPSWVMAPFLRQIREASCHAAAAMAEGTYEGIPTMRVTAHAGEDFHGPMDGIRRIDELLTSGTLRDGDRIGHGLALGLNVRSYHHPFHEPREERLFDLLWEIELAERGKLTVSGSRLLKTKRRVQDLLGEHYAKLGYEKVYELPRQLLDEERLKIAGVYAPIAKPFEEPLKYYLTDPDFLAWGRLPVLVTYGEDDFEVAEQAQRVVRAEVARREIVVEANPTSNLILADLDALTDHPMMTLAPLNPALGDEDRVAVAICDDDPISFASCLSDEVAYTYAALREQSGASSEQALAWIERARELGMRARFTVPESRSLERMKGLLDELELRWPNAGVKNTGSPVSVCCPHGCGNKSAHRVGATSSGTSPFQCSNCRRWFQIVYSHGQIESVERG